MKQIRTVFRIDIQKFLEYAAKMASNGIFTSGFPGAVEMITEVGYMQNGTEKRALTPEECSGKIHKGGFR